MRCVSKMSFITFTKEDGYSSEAKLENQSTKLENKTFLFQMIFIVFSYSLNFVLFVKLDTKIDINRTVIVDSVIAHFEHILSQNLDCCNKI